MGEFTETDILTLAIGGHWEEVEAEFADPDKWLTGELETFGRTLESLARRAWAEWKRR